jgi:hypothetical protein
VVVVGRGVRGEGMRRVRVKVRGRGVWERRGKRMRRKRVVRR